MKTDSLESMKNYSYKVTYLDIKSVIVHNILEQGFSTKGPRGSTDVTNIKVNNLFWFSKVFIYTLKRP